MSHSEAITMFDGCIKYLLEQKEDTLHNITVLTELREMAARKRLTNLKQKKITDYMHT